MTKYPSILVDCEEVKAFDQPLTYRATSKHITEGLQLGCYVAVPFRAKLVGGFVVGFEEQQQLPAGKLKAIKEILEPTPLFNKKLLELAKWIASQYYCPLLFALDCVLPPRALWKQVIAQVKLKEVSAEILGKLKDSQQAAKELIERLRQQQEAQRQPVELKELKRTFDYEDISEFLQYLKRKKLIEIEYIIKPPKYRLKKVSDGHSRSILLTAPQQDNLNSLQEKALKAVKIAIESPSQSLPILVQGSQAERLPIYIAAISHIIKNGQVLIIVPEIQLAQLYLENFKRDAFAKYVAVWHSKLSQKEQIKIWQAIYNGEVKVVLGTRSAIFLPLNNLKLIIVEDEHEPYYKQEATPKYHLREVALKRSKIEPAAIIVGSYTPSVETFYLARRRRFQYFDVREPAAQASILAKTKIVDLRHHHQQQATTRGKILSYPLKVNILNKVRAGRAVCIFLNRRGFASALTCLECGFILKCELCASPLVYHRKEGKLICHYCGKAILPVEYCPNCEGFQLELLGGGGTELLEQELNELLEHKVDILRVDSDIVYKKADLDKLLIKAQGAQVMALVGTQLMFNLPYYKKASLIGVVALDTLFCIPDFRGAERAFQLLSKLIGANNGNNVEREIIIQTYNPDHYVVAAAKQRDYFSFYKNELKHRYQLNYPPFSRLVKIVVRDYDYEATKRLAETLYQLISQAIQDSAANIELLGPSPAVLWKLRGIYRWQILLKVLEHRALNKILDSALANLRAQRHKIIIDIDPMEWH